MLNSGWWQKPAGSLALLIKYQGAIRERERLEEHPPKSDLAFQMAVLGMTEGRRLRTDPLNWGLTGLGSFFSLNSLIESQITFDFTLRPDSVQCIVMKGSARHRRRQ